MNKLKNVWVIADKADQCRELLSGAAELGEQVSVVYAGARDIPLPADEAYYLGEITEEKRWHGYIPAIQRLVSEKAPELVLTGTTKDGRLAAGAVAAACRTSVITDISEISTEEGISAKRMIYGGTAYRTEKPEGKVCVACVGAGRFEARDLDKTAAVTDVGEAGQDGRIRCCSVKKKQGANVNIAAAKKVVSVGRGIGAQENLEAIGELAARLGAAVGCSRPIAEEMKWLPREAYVGVSGVMVQPDVYIAIGISGQIQHMVGCNQSGILIGINKDKNAPLFRYVDYGIVGDCKKVVPLLLDQING